MMFGLYLIAFNDITDKLWWFEIVSFICIMVGMYDALPHFYYVGAW